MSVDDPLPTAVLMTTSSGRVSSALTSAIPIGCFRACNRRVTMTARAWPWSAVRYRTRIARHASVPPDCGLYIPN
jgi:hypothetical protein